MCLDITWICLFELSIIKGELSVFSAATMTPSLQMTPTQVLTDKKEK